jgi:hypothetical protein
MATLGSPFSIRIREWTAQNALGDSFQLGAWISAKILDCVPQMFTRCADVPGRKGIEPPVPGILCKTFAADRCGTMGF